MAADNEKIFIDADDGQYQLKEIKDTTRILVFCLGKEYYGLDVAVAREVFRPGQITRIPTAPDFIRGLTNLRGRVIPLVDISCFLGMAPVAITGSTQVVVLEHKNDLLGMVVDRIDGAREIEKSSIQPPLATLKIKLSDFTVGQVELEGGILAILDLKKILDLDEFKSLRNQA